MMTESLKQYIKPSFYKEQFTGWTKSSYTLLMVGIMIQLFIGLKDGFNLIGVIATLAGVIGFTTTIAITNGKSINGLLGLISALMFMFVALVTDNPSTIIMQLAYIILLDMPIILGSWHTFEPKKMMKKDIYKTILTFIIIFILLFTLDKFILNSPQAFLDAFSATIGLVGAILCVKQFRAQYYFWTLGGMLSVALWVETAMNGNATWVLMVTYILYLTNDVIAFLDSNWFSKNKK